MVLCKHDRDGFWDLSESGRKPKGGIIIQKTKMDRDAVRTLANHEKRVEEARKFNLLSNVFMSVALNDIPACQYVLRILTGIEDLVVKEVRSQYRISKIHSHDAILDILAEDGTGKLYNLEIQRADTIDHARRTRFYGAMIDSEYLEKGKTYAELPDVYVIYISETDLWKAGYTTYPVEKHFGNTSIPYEDGQHILYVNAAVDDGSETAKLMQYFKTADPNDMTHGDLSKRVHYLKGEEGGYQEMCEISEKIYREGMEDGIAQVIEQGIAQGVAQGIAQGKLESQKETVKSLAEIGMAVEDIAKAMKVSAEQVQEWLSESESPAE